MMVYLDAPAPCIPTESFTGLFEGVRLNRGKKHPFQRRCDRRGRIDFSGINHPDRYGCVAFAVGRPELDLRMAHLEFGVAGDPRAFTGNMHHLNAGDRLPVHFLPEILVSAFPLAGTFATNQEFWSLRIVQGFQEQLIDVRFPVSHADQHGLGAKLPGLRHRPVALEPFHALLLLDGQFLAAISFPFFFRVACPTLDVEQPQRRSLCGESHRIVNHQPVRIAFPRADRPQALGDPVRGTKGQTKGQSNKGSSLLLTHYDLSNLVNSMCNGPIVFSSYSSLRSNTCSSRLPRFTT